MDAHARSLPADADDAHRASTLCDHRLPVVGLFNEDPSLSYPISQAATTWLVDRYGIARLLDLMRAYRAHYAGADVDALTPKLLGQVYGVTPAQVTAGAWSLLADYSH